MEPDKAVQSERLAEVAAVELSYPHEYRPKDAADVAAGKTTIGKLALEYNLPPFIISRALNDGYRKLVDEYRARAAKVIQG